MAKVFGSAIKRGEDPRLITGRGKYLDDIQLPGMLHAAILRSPYAHAKIKSIDISKAAEVPGVVGVCTGKDFEDLPTLPCAWQAQSGKVANYLNTPRVLEIDKVTFTGAGVGDRRGSLHGSGCARIDRSRLRSAADATVVNAEEATKPGAPQLHDNAANNICFDWNCGDQEATDQALSQSDLLVKQRLVNQRLIPTPLEPRGVIGQYNAATEEYTVWMTSQAPHVMRLLMTAFVFGIPETKMRVIAPQVGGGFGAKIFLYPRVLPHGCLDQEARPPGEVDGDAPRKLRRDHPRS